MAKLDLPLIVVGEALVFMECNVLPPLWCVTLTQKATGESVIFLLSEDTTLQRGGSIFIFRISTVENCSQWEEPVSSLHLEVYCRNWERFPLQCMIPTYS